MAHCRPPDQNTHLEVLFLQSLCERWCLLSDNNSSRYRQLEWPIRKENIQPMQEGRNALPDEKSYLGVVDPAVFSGETTFGFQYSRGNHAVQGKIRGRVNARKQ